MVNYGRGLVFAQLPTSDGKTYSACAAIAEYVKKYKGRENFRKIVFVTSRLKNLPEKELREAFGREGMDYDSIVLKVQNRMDCIKEARNNGFLSVRKEADKEQREILSSKALDGMLDYLMKIENNEKVLTGEQKVIVIGKYRNAFGKNEKSFRKSINRLLLETAKLHDKSVKDTLLSNQFEWVRNIYPQEDHEKYSVILMSAAELAKGSLSFGEKTSYLSEKWLGDKIIFFDECDAIKEDFINACLGNTEKLDNIDYAKIDVRKLFMSIMRGLEEISLKSYSKYTFDAINYKDVREVLLKKARPLEDKYNISMSFRFNEQKKEDWAYFFYRCGMWATATTETKGKYIWAKEDVDRKMMVINTGTKEEYEKAYNAGAISFHEMFREIIHFINTFISRFTYICVPKYLEDLRRIRPLEYITEEEAAYSLLNKFFFNEPETERDMIISGMRLLTSRKMVRMPYSPTTYYNKGAVYFSLRELRREQDDTEMSMFSIKETPERIMLFLARNCLCIGFSATALCPTVLGNFNLDYLRDELEMDDEEEGQSLYHDMLKEHPGLKELIIERHNLMGKKYHDTIDYAKDREIDINIDILYNSYKGQQYEKEGILPVRLQESTRWIELWLSDPKFVETVSKIESLYQDADDNYKKSRYANTALVMLSFAANIEHQSCLCIGSKLPQYKDKDFDLEKLTHIAEIINNYYKERDKDNYWDFSLFKLDSSNYEEDKKEVLDRLKRGERLIIISSYSTIAAGQNMQHIICDRVRPYLIKVDGMEERNDSFKDIDEIAFLDCTNVVVNFTQNKEFSPKDTMRNIIQTEECYESDVFSLPIKDAQITEGLERMYNRNEKWGNKIKNSKPFKCQIAHWIIQAEGRTKRTPWRTRHQQIYIDDKVLAALDNDYVKSIQNVCSPEMQELYREAVRFNSVPEKSPVPEYIIEAERKDINAKKYIQSMLKSINVRHGVIEWSENNMMEWKNMRNFVLQNPSGLSEEERMKNPFYRNFYISLPPDDDIAPEYYYFSEGDFKQTWITFNLPLGGMKKYVKNRLPRNWAPKEVFANKVSMEESRLKTFLAYPGMREYFEQNGYAEVWHGGHGTFMMPPYIYQAVYLGALGEACGKFILERETGLSFEDINDVNKFEAFDFALKENKDIYVDFKHWKGREASSSQLIKNQRWINEIKRKMENGGAKAVFIIGLIEDVQNKEKGKEYDDFKQKDSNIFYIPSLIDNSGRAIDRNISAFKFIYDKIK